MLSMVWHAVGVLVEQLEQAGVTRAVKLDLFEVRLSAHHCALKVVVVRHVDWNRNVALWRPAHLVHLESNDGHSLTVEVGDHLGRELNWREPLPPDLRIELRELRRVHIKAVSPSRV